VVVLKHNDIKKAAEIVKNGGVIIYPTDTIWGIGCDASNKVATERIIKLKQKPTNSSLIWLFPSIRAVKKYFAGRLSLSWAYEKLLSKKRTTVILDDIAVRVVKRGRINKFIARCGVPIVSTSANIHGGKTVQSWRQAAEFFDDSVDAIIRGRKKRGGVQSTVVKIENGKIKILRAGGGISIK
jgi:L-threonylcarbamoyladenylate synthase